MSDESTKDPTPHSVWVLTEHIAEMKGVSLTTFMGVKRVRMRLSGMDLYFTPEQARMVGTYLIGAAEEAT
jgi:hypothetical protein